MVNYLVRELAKAVVGFQGVRVEIRSGFHVLTDQCLNICLTPRLDNLHANLSATLQNGCNNRFAIRPATVDLFSPFVRVHVPCLAADERLIGLNFPREFSSGLALKRKARPLQHEPCRLLGDSYSPVNLPGRNTVLAVSNKPDNR